MIAERSEFQVGQRVGVCRFGDRCDVFSAEFGVVEKVTRTGQVRVRPEGTALDGHPRATLTFNPDCTERGDKGSRPLRVVTAGWLEGRLEAEAARRANNEAARDVLTYLSGCKAPFGDYRFTADNKAELLALVNLLEVVDETE